MITAAPDTFFTIRGTMPSTAPSYVKRKADDQLYQALARGEFCFLLTSRQVGKSSLMTRAAVAMRAEKNGAAVVVLDVTSQGANVTAQQWYAGLLDQIGEQLRLEDELAKYWRDHAHFGVLRRWISAITRVALPALGQRPLVIFIDEVDFTRTLPFPTDEFFAGIRECYNRRMQEPELSRLTFCLIGSARPIDLMRDIRTTPFNIGQRIDLTDFTLEEALPLTNGLHADPARAKALLERVLYWTGGHPYLTQQLCCAVATGPKVKGPRDVDAICARLFFSPRGRDNDDNLVFVRDRILKTEQDPAGVLDLYRNVLNGKRIKAEDNNPLIGVLRLAGIVRLIDGHLVVRNRIYRHVFNRKWVEANMPDQEKRRQRAAYRLGLIRLGVPAAIIVAMVSSLAGFALKKKVEAEDAKNRALEQKTLADEARKHVSNVLDSAYKSNTQFLRTTEFTGMSGATRDLVVNAALAQLTDLTKNLAPEDHDLQLKVAGAYDAIGRVQLKLLDLEVGTPEEARASYDRALNIRLEQAKTGRSKDSEQMALASTCQARGNAYAYPPSAGESDEARNKRLQTAGECFRDAEAIRRDELARHPREPRYAVPMARTFIALGDFVDRQGAGHLTGAVRSTVEYLNSAVDCLEELHSVPPQDVDADNSDDRPTTMVETTRANAFERLGLLFAGKARTPQEAGEARKYLEKAAFESACCADSYRNNPDLRHSRDGVNAFLDAAKKELALARFDYENKSGARDQSRTGLMTAARYLGAALGPSQVETTANRDSLIELVPVNIDVRKCLAEVYELMARLDSADVNGGKGGCDAALAMCKRATQERLVVHQLNPESHRALDALAQAYVQQGYAAYRAKGASEAVATFEMVPPIYPTDPSHERKRTRAEAEALLGLGIAMHDMGMFTNARASLENAIASFDALDQLAKDPALRISVQRNSARAKAALAANWAAQNENSTAEKEYAAAIEIQEKLVEADPDLGTVELVSSLARRAAALGAVNDSGHAADHAQASRSLSQSAIDMLNKRYLNVSPSDPRLKDAVLLERLADVFIDLAKAWKSTGKWAEAHVALDDAKPLFDAPQRDHASVIGVTSDYEKMTLSAEINYALWLAADSSGKAMAGMTAQQLQPLIDQEIAYKDYRYAHHRDPDNFRILGEYLTISRFAGLINMRSSDGDLPKADTLLSDTLRFRQFMVNRYSKDVEVASAIFESFTELEELYKKETKSDKELARLRTETVGALINLVDQNYPADSAPKLSAQIALANFYLHCEDKQSAQAVLQAAEHCAKSIQKDYPDAFARWQEFQARLSKPN